MRIAIDTSFEHPNLFSSALDYLRAMVEWLARVGGEHEFEILVSTQMRRHFVPLVRDNVTLVGGIISNERRNLRIFSQQVLFPPLLRGRHVDALFAPGNVCPILSSVPTVLKINTLHHLQTPEAVSRLRSWYRGIAFQRSAERANVIIANSQYTRDAICRLMGISPAKVRVVYEAADATFEEDCSEQAAHAQVEWMAQQGLLGRRYLLYPAALWPYKNHLNLLHAFALVANSFPDCDLLLVGRDDPMNAPDPGGNFPSYRARLESVAENLKIARRVHFAGFVPISRMPFIYAHAEALVYPSQAETFGKPLVEAMWSGCPVVGGEATCIPEILGGAGLLADVHDPAALAAKLRLVLASTELRQEMRDKGFRRAREFSWETQASATLELIVEAAASAVAARGRLGADEQT